MAFTTIPSFSTTPATNTDINNVSIAEGFPAANINNAMRALCAMLRTEIALFDTVAASATPDIRPSGFFTVSGSGATITSFSILSGSRRILHFQGANTLAYDGTAMIIPGGANLPIAANDCIEVVAVADNQVRVINYFPNSGINIIGNSTATDGYVLTANGAGVAPTWQEPPASGVSGSCRTARGQVSGNASYNYAADELIVKTTAGVSRNVNMRRTTQIILADMSLSGASGLDTGAEAADTHYYVWAIDRTTPYVDQAVTADAGADTIELTAHGLPNGTCITFLNSGTPPTGITAANTYYVITATADDFQVASSPTGAAVNITAPGADVVISTQPTLMFSASPSAPTMPSGFTFKALVAWARNDGSSNFIRNWVRDRRINFPNQNVLTAGAVTTPGTFQSLGVGTVLPGIAQTASGVAGRSDTAAGATYGIAVAGDNSNPSWQGWGASNETTAVLSFGGRGVFSDVILTHLTVSAAPDIYWTASVTSAFGRIDINGFTF